MAPHISTWEILKAGGVTLVFLIGLSIYSLALIWERWNFFRRSLRDLHSFIQRLRTNLSKGDLNAVMNYCKEHRGPASEIIMSALVGPTHKEDRKRATERTLERETVKLQKGLNALGTIGAVAPFIGLFGTVLGVMRAFRDLAGAAGAGPGVVAVGISEALVATAAGLFVAIPATVGFNYFTTRVTRFAEELRWLTDEILDQLTQKSHS